MNECENIIFIVFIKDTNYGGDLCVLTIVCSGVASNEYGFQEFYNKYITLEINLLLRASYGRI